MRWNYIGVVALCMLCISIGYALRGAIDNQVQVQVLQGASAYGLYEEKQVWNRIRVNEKGYVICAKE